MSRFVVPSTEKTGPLSSEWERVKRLQIGRVKPLAGGCHATQPLTRRKTRRRGRKSVESLHDLGQADAVGIAQRAAAEGGETRSEHHRQVDVVRLLDNSLVETAGRFIDQRI